MAKKTYLRFTIDVAGAPRTLLSVVQKRDGTVIVRPKADYGLRPAWSIDTADRIFSQKYTIHPSVRSEIGINTIHSTTVLVSGKKLEWRHLTKALKSGERYALLYVRRCANLEQLRYISKSPAENVVDLGGYDPTLYTLYYALFVGPPDMTLDVPNEAVLGLGIHRFNARSYDLQNARLTMVWSFLRLSSLLASLTYHHSTLDPKMGGDPKIMDGYAPDEAVRTIVGQFEVLEQEQRTLRWLQRGVTPTGGAMIRFDRWSNDGTVPRGTAEDDDWITINAPS
ncbi:hypothetical protein [Bradyrhizobium sp. AZCC 2230]|uniref:hypothetical protein n=1 Tax=Bradyrhizobium sp. AZCC 2230 TaxID=3117021 RepID=UPI002FEEC10D